MSLNKYKAMSNSAGISEGKLTEEFMFTIEVADIFLFENNIGCTDIVDGFVDGRSDGGIDFIFSNGEIVTLMQGKSTKNLSYEEAIAVFDKIIRTIEDFDNNEYGKYSKKLVSSYLNALDSVDDYNTIEIILCTNTLLSDRIKNNLETELQKDKYSNYKCIVYDAEEIERRKEIFEIESEFVDEDKLKTTEANNYLYFENSEGNKGYIFNVKASSIKKLYDKHTSKSLFSYNLRDFIGNKSVDNGINETISSERNNFWFYNINDFRRRFKLSLKFFY